MGHGRLLAGVEVGVGAGDAGERLDTWKRVRKGLDAFGAQTLQFGAPRAEQLVEPMLFPAHRGEAT
jgi:hypothetical protein